MKSILLAFIAILSLSAGAQVQIEEVAGKTEIGEARQGAKLIARLYALHSAGDTMYVLMYRNREFDAINDIKTIEFNATPEDVKSLYNVLTQTLNTGTDAALTLGTTFVKITKPKGMGGAIRVGTGEGWFYLTRGQLDKLFGKVR